MVYSKNNLNQGFYPISKIKRTVGAIGKRKTFYIGNKMKGVVRYTKVYNLGKDQLEGIKNALFNGLR